jgi:hypothetical protein
MLELLKKDDLPPQREVLTLEWYPSERSCRVHAGKTNRLKRVPPLMVRKAEWRR